jgi:hypothetical protein
MLRAFRGLGHWPETAFGEITHCIGGGSDPTEQNATSGARSTRIRPVSEWRDPGLNCRAGTGGQQYGSRPTGRAERLLIWNPTRCPGPSKAGSPGRADPSPNALTFYIWMTYYVAHLGMDTKKSDLLQGTLDMLVLKIVALGPIHGYAIAQRIIRFRARCYRCSKARCIRRCIVWRSVACYRRNGGRSAAGKRSSIR